MVLPGLMAYWPLTTSSTVSSTVPEGHASSARKTSVPFLGLVGSLPLLFLLLPGAQNVDVFGVPLPLVVLAVPLFPLITMIGLLYQRRADAIDDAFRDAVSGD